MPRIVRVTTSGQTRITTSSDVRVTTDSSPVPSGVRVTENNVYRVTEDGIYRVIESSSIQQSFYSDLSAKVNVTQPYDTSDINAKVTIERYEYKDLGAKVNVIKGKADLSAKVTVEKSNYSDIQAKVKLVTYTYKNLLARVFIEGTSDLSAKINIKPYKDLLAKVFTYHGIKARLFVPGRTPLGGKLTVDVSHQLLGAKVTVEQYGYKDLGGYVVVGKMTSDIGGKLYVDPGQQRIAGKLTVLASGYIDLNAKVYVDPGQQRIVGKVTVDRYTYNDLSAKLNVDTSLQEIDGKVTIEVIGEDDISASVDVTANVPDAVYPTGYVIPSGYPPLPSDWQDSNGNAIPGPNAQVIPEGQWQQEEEILFIWQPPSGWGYGANEDGYIVAWNDDENYVVTQSDQYVANNYIDKSWYDSGSMWFHIKARNSYGWLGPQSKYNVKINQLPTPPVDPMYIDTYPNPSGVTNSSRPIFYWGNASDPDQLDVLKYDLQIYPSGVQPGGPETYSIYNIPSVGTGSTTYYKIQFDLTEGLYQWRVRTYDTKQYSDWSDSQPLIVKTTGNDIKASLKLVQPWFNSLLARINIKPYSDLEAKIFIEGISDLKAKLFIPNFSDLPAKLYIPPGKDIKAKVLVTASGYKDLFGRLTVRHFADLPAKINIQPKNDISGKVTIDVTHQTIFGKVNVCYIETEDLFARVHVHGDLKGKVTVIIPASGDLNSKLTVVIPSGQNLSGKVNIKPYNNLLAKVRIPTTIDLSATVDVNEDIPDDVVIQCNIPNETWQENNHAQFSWVTPNDDFYPVNEYYIAWNQIKDYTVSESDQRINSNSIDKYAYEAGKYYFHIRAVNSIGHWSKNTSHYGVWYNHVPSGVQPPLLTENQSNPIINTVAPTLSWGNATDQDQLDVIRYNVQISKVSDFSTLEYNIENINSLGVGNRTEYQLESQYYLKEIGQYFWRVRAWDGKQYSIWSGTASFTLVPATNDLSAKLTIPTEVKLNLPAKVNIIGHKELIAKVYISKTTIKDLGAKLNVCRIFDSELQARVRIFSTMDLPAKVNIRPYIDLNGKLNVINVPGYNNLSVKLNVCDKADSEIRGRLRVCYGSSKDLNALIRIVSNKDLSSKVTVYTPEHFGFIDDFSKDLQSKINIAVYFFKDLQVRVNVEADKPSAVTISANVPEATWQNNKDITFTWTQAHCNFLTIEGYYTELDHNPNTIANDSFQRTMGFSRSFDLENEDGAGIYYFHVAARASNGEWGPTSHYEVRYNHIPTDPTGPLYVNDQNCQSQFVMVATSESMTLKWGQSYDNDSLDTITYKLQIATQEDFGVKQDRSSSIIYEEENIPIYYKTLNTGLLSSNTYYWRVKAFDGHQYSSGWSPIGRLIVNTPPEQPKNLVVF
ncbi:MAG: hypothetical protein ACP6IQ_02375 [Candidatus Njordarchaeia archaeon]